MHTTHRVIERGSIRSLILKPTPKDLRLRLSRHRERERERLLDKAKVGETGPRRISKPKTKPDGNSLTSFRWKILPLAKSLS